MSKETHWKCKECWVCDSLVINDDLQRRLSEWPGVF